MGNALNAALVNSRNVAKGFTLFLAGGVSIALAVYLEGRTNFYTPGASLAIALFRDTRLLKTLGIYVAVDLDAAIFLGVMWALYMLIATFSRGRGLPSSKSQRTP